jgi:hypothetical protein
MKDPAIIALEALGHVKVANTRCQARYKYGLQSAPGPYNIPVWCDLEAGHEGLHKHCSGHRLVTMDREHLIEMIPLPDVCQKCGTRWPCQDAEKVLAAFANPDPCACFPEHCTDTSHGDCWCNPTHEGNLVIHNQAS